MDKRKIGELIRQERTRQHLTCKKLGELAGVSAATISRAEFHGYNGYCGTSQFISHKSLLKICAVLGIEEIIPEKEREKELIHVRDKTGLIPRIMEAIEVSDGNTEYFIGFRNGLRYARYLIDGIEPEFEICKGE